MLGISVSIKPGQAHTPNVRLRDFLESLRRSQPDLNDAFTCLALVEVLSNFLATEVPESDNAEVLDSYTGSLDVYIRAVAHSSTGMASLASRPG